jgi:hypothetical protein
MTGARALGFFTSVIGVPVKAIALLLTARWRRRSESEDNCVRESPERARQPAGRPRCQSRNILPPRLNNQEVWTAGSGARKTRIVGSARGGKSVLDKNRPSYGSRKKERHASRDKFTAVKVRNLASLPCTQNRVCALLKSRTCGISDGTLVPNPTLTVKGVTSPHNFLSPSKQTS